MPRHAGYLEHPKKLLPAEEPFLARLTFISEPHLGQTEVNFAGASISGEDRTESATDLADAKSCFNSDPASNWMLRPLAKATASSVKEPLVTTKPPAAPSAAMTP